MRQHVRRRLRGALRRRGEAVRHRGSGDGAVMRGLGGKGVLLSGGGRGIGRATARRFLEEGARVYLAALEPDEVDATVRGFGDLGDVAGAPCDVREESDVVRTVEGAE